MFGMTLGVGLRYGTDWWAGGFPPALDGHRASCLFLMGRGHPARPCYAGLLATLLSMRFGGEGTSPQPPGRRGGPPVGRALRGALSPSAGYRSRVVLVRVGELVPGGRGAYVGSPQPQRRIGSREANKGLRPNLPAGGVDFPSAGLCAERLVHPPGTGAEWLWWVLVTWSPADGGRAKAQPPGRRGGRTSGCAVAARRRGSSSSGH